MDSVSSIPGYVRLPRSIISSELFATPNALSLFINLLLRANREEKQLNGITIQRGQVVTSRRSLSRQTGLSEKSVRIALQKLQTLNVVHLRAHKGAQEGAHEKDCIGAYGFTLITICNFDNYDSAMPQGGQRDNVQGAHERAQQRAITKEYIYNNKYIREIFGNDAFLPVVADWLDYKIESGHPLTNISLSKFCALLKELSGGDSEVARNLTDEAIAAGWTTIYKRSQKVNKKMNSRAVPDTESRKSISKSTEEYYSTF